MKNYRYLIIVTALGMLLCLGCSGDDNIINSNSAEFNVRYEVVFISPGAVKITHKDSHGREIFSDPVSADWQREYNFGGQVDALLDVEMSEVAPVNEVVVQLGIYIDGIRAQQSTATITSDKKSSLALTRP